MADVHHMRDLLAEWLRMSPIHLSISLKLCGASKRVPSLILHFAPFCADPTNLSLLDNMLFSYLYILILCSYTQFTNAVPAEGAPVTDPNYKVYVSGNDQITGDGSTRIYDPDARNAALVREGYGSTGFPPDSWLGYALDMRKGAGLNTLQWNIVSVIMQTLNNRPLFPRH